MLLAQLHETVGKGHDYVKQIEEMVKEDFVILDDLGSTGLNDWRKEVLFEFIDQRYASERPTVITSNLTFEEIQQNLHPRVASRLFAKENTIIQIWGEDKRGAPLAPPLPPDPLEGVAKKPWDKPK